jgi:hypothetical protein
MHELEAIALGLGTLVARSAVVRPSAVLMPSTAPVSQPGRFAFQGEIQRGPSQPLPPLGEAPLPMPSYGFPLRDVMAQQSVDGIWLANALRPTKTVLQIPPAFGGRFGSRDRLGRDLRHLVNTVEDLRTRGVGLKVLTGAGAQIDTTTANGRLAFGIFAAFAEFERELIAERTMAGLAAARARGRMGGRPRKMDRSTLTMAMAAMADRKAVAADVAMRLGLTTTTLYVYVNGDGTPKAAGQALLDGTPRPGAAAKARTRPPQAPPLGARLETASV